MGIYDWFAAHRRRWIMKKRGGGDNAISSCYPRFGTLAVEYGFVTPEQVKLALAEQIDDNLAGRRHRVIGAILFEKGLMSSGEIDQVLNAMFETVDDLDREEEVFGAVAAAGFIREGSDR